MNMRYYKTIEWEKIHIEKEYNQHIKHTIARAVKITDVQQLAYKSILNNFALNIWPINKLLFLIKLQLKLTK